MVVASISRGPLLAPFFKHIQCPFCIILIVLIFLTFSKIVLFCHRRRVVRIYRNQILSLRSYYGHFQFNLQYSCDQNSLSSLMQKAKIIHNQMHIVFLTKCYSMFTSILNFTKSIFFCCYLLHMMFILKIKSNVCNTSSCLQYVEYTFYFDL